MGLIVLYFDWRRTSLRGESTFYCDISTPVENNIEQVRSALRNVRGIAQDYSWYTVWSIQKYVSPPVMLMVLAPEMTDLSSLYGPRLAG